MNVGIVCEYNPFHKGHEKQFRLIREKFGPDTGIICAMSGNYVQRGYPAVFDKSVRAEAAVRCGADLVVELPVTVSLSSAEGFASGSVSILSKLCDGLCFGAETADRELLMDMAAALISEAFPCLLHKYLDTGMSFPAARQAALAEMGLPGNLLELPNNILAVEYCKAILRHCPSLKPLPIYREGSYHARQADPDNPSATSLRQLLDTGCSLTGFVPEKAAEIFRKADIHTLEAGQRAILMRLRTMPEDAFEALPFGSEGLWRKLMHESRRCTLPEEIACAVKSKRYTRSRIDRMILCAFLGITAQMMEAQIPYVRVLAFNDRGRQILSSVRKTGFFLNTGEQSDHPFWNSEILWDDLYELFRTRAPGAPGKAKKRRVFYLR